MTCWEKTKSGFGFSTENYSGNVISHLKSHFYSFRKHKRNYVTNDDIDMKFGTDASNSRTMIKIKECPNRLACEV